jgi:hypothetical protein
MTKWQELKSYQTLFLVNISRNFCINYQDSIADELVAMGVPKTDIVLAYHAPYNRQFTEFSVS